MVSARRARLRAAKRIILTMQAMIIAELRCRRGRLLIIVLGDLPR
jgi:hypothetical protein